MPAIDRDKPIGYRPTPALFRLSGVLLALILAAISGTMLGTCAAGVAYAGTLVR